MWYKNESLDQLLHCVQTEETDYKNVFLQPAHVHSEPELPFALHGCSCINLLAFRADIFATLVS